MNNNMIYKNYDMIEKFISIGYQKRAVYFNTYNLYYEDVKQEIYLYIISYSEKFDNKKSTVEQFLYTIIEQGFNTIIRRLNTEKRRANQNNVYVDSIDYFDLRYSENYHNIDFKETIKNKLNEEETEIIKYILNGFTVSEIARITNYSRQNIYTMFKKLRVKLKDVV